MANNFKDLKAKKFLSMLPARQERFENAKAERFGNIVIYTILNEDDSQKVYSEIKKQSKKGQKPLYLLIGRHTFADAPLLLKSLQAA